MTELVVVGGGPSGLATAILAAQRGLRVVVVERGRAPLEKACGEGIMPYGVAALEEMGAVPPESRSAPFGGIRYVEGDSAAEGRFRGRPGLGVERTVLSETLLRRARETGVEIRLGETVTGWEATPRGVRVRTSEGEIEGRVLVGADGAGSVVRRLAGLEPRSPDPPARFGVRRHYAVAPWTDFVEVHLSDGAEAYVTPTGPDRVGVALLWSRRALGPATHEALLDRFPAVRARLGAGRPVDPPLGAGPFPRGARRRTSERVVLVGDAAGYLDPLAGDGVALGFETARALVETVAAGEPLSRYERRWRRLTRRHRAATRALLAVAARPRLRRRAVAAIARHPALFEGLLEMMAGGGDRSDARWP